MKKKSAPKKTTKNGVKKAISHLKEDNREMKAETKSHNKLIKKLSKSKRCK